MKSTIVGSGTELTQPAEFTFPMHNALDPAFVAFYAVSHPYFAVRFDRR